MIAAPFIQAKANTFKNEKIHQVKAKPWEICRHICKEIDSMFIAG